MLLRARTIEDGFYIIIFISYFIFICLGRVACTPAISMDLSLIKIVSMQSTISIHIPQALCEEISAAFNVIVHSIVQMKRIILWTLSKATSWKQRTRFPYSWKETL